MFKKMKLATKMILGFSLPLAIISGIVIGIFIISGTVESNAKLAKELNLDAIHDTVHEMCKDEARHGQAFKGLLDRYFGQN